MVVEKPDPTPDPIPLGLEPYRDDGEHEARFELLRESMGLRWVRRIEFLRWLYQRPKHGGL